MKSNYYALIIFVFFSIVFFSGSAQACETCPPDPPCAGCPPDVTVPLDGGLTLVLLGGAALAVKKMLA
jgi:hypothetical protein